MFVIFLFQKVAKTLTSLLFQERKKYVQFFPAVICDLSAHYNLTHRMTKGGLNEVFLVINSSRLGLLYFPKMEYISHIFNLFLLFDF